MKEAGRRIVILAYDFRGISTHDKAEMEWKTDRDGYTKTDAILLICWSKKRETTQLSPRIRIESFPAFAGAFRPVYDLLFPFVAVFVMRKQNWKPDRIVIAEWPLAWGAAAVRLFFGGEIVVRLIGLPRHIARTRSIFHYLYTVTAEFLLCRIPDRCVAISDSTAEYALARGMPRSSVFLLPLDSIRADAAYLKEAKRGIARKELGIPADVPIVISVGRLEAEKAFDELIRVFGASRPDARLVILGEGSLRERLEVVAKEHGCGKVILAGKKSRKDIWNYYTDASAFVLLSISEGLGLVFWEAMYMHVPVIGRPVGGIVDTIGKDRERGFFWNTEDGTDAFSEKLGRCLARGKEVENMIQRAREYVNARLQELSTERPY